MIIDCHCDTVLQAYLTDRLITARSSSGHLDLPRLQESGVKIQFFALFPGISSSLSPLKQILILDRTNGKDSCLHPWWRTTLC